MIKFFRKIRYDLMKKNKTSKYIKYAIGEIVLVVIGILLALQLNTWKTNSTNQRQEQVLLIELQGEYQDKLKELEDKVAIRNVMLSSCNLLLEGIDTKNYDMPQDSLNKYAGAMILTPTFDASNSVTDELINSGKLYLIKNKQLRKQILDWSSTLAKLVEEEQMYIELALSKYYPYFLDNFPIRNGINPLLKKNSELRKNWLKTSLNNNITLENTNHPVDIEKLFNDLVFENIVGMIQIEMVVANMQSQDVRNHIDSVLENIQSELM